MSKKMKVKVAQLCFLGIVLVGILILRQNVGSVVYKRNTVVCTDTRLEHKGKKKLPLIYGITSTYTRHVQIAELTRLSQTLMHIPMFHWLLTEDAHSKTDLVAHFLNHSNLSYTHLFHKNNSTSRLVKDLNTRNNALRWIRENVQPSTNAILYFMDDDNTYSLRVFDEIRKTKRGRAWPVGLSAGLLHEGPIECKDGKAVRWNVHWWPQRTVPIDMAGFAIHVKVLFEKPTSEFTDREDIESVFLESLGFNRDNMEVNYCKDVLVWHTQTKTPVIVQ
uniref:Galactosylgalactosylxylosylprotein 3-beta-glucuronosyltransferase n=1 Tax=Ciona savignyi TaxID=51511 RepID=Q4VYB0_CIOSA|nr:beta-1,3-glucuronosyltransferase [Ciona savignyi]